MFGLPQYLFQLHYICLIYVDVSISTPVKLSLRHYPYRFGLRVLRTLPTLLDGVTRVFPDPPDDFDPLECYMSQSFDDWWDDAALFDVIRYLRGNKSLKIPSERKPHLLP